MKSTNEQPSLQDRQRRRAVRTMQIAHAAFHLGNYTTLAWVAKGINSLELTPEDTAYFGEARSIIHSNRGKLRRGDAALLMKRTGGNPQ